MKKLFLALAIICAVILSAGVCFADQPTKPCQENLETEIKQIENVRDCKVVCFAGYCFIALRTQGITTKTAMNELTEKVIAFVKEKCPRIEHVFVSTAVKTFAALQKLTYENIWEELTELFDLDENEYPLPKIRPMPFLQPKPDESPETSQN